MQFNWGIHPTKAYAIPFIAKDKPSLKSTFSSIILTFFLTIYYYYYYYDTESNIPPLILDFIIQTKIYKEQEFGGYDYLNISVEQVKQIYQNYRDKIIEYIISTIEITEEQINISFVDLLLIDNIYKIGYSGTVNVLFPEVDNLKYEKYEDKDESINIAYAISQAKIIPDDEKQYVYDAYIDVCCNFRLETNESKAKQLSDKQKRHTIFIDDSDTVKYIDHTDKSVKTYDDKLQLETPIMYYDQAHTIGTDIKQERYTNMIALCYVDIKSTYTAVAQGLYRMRKLNAGQKVDFCFVGDGEITNINELYILLLNNQSDYIKQSKPLLNYQIIKALSRKAKTSEKKVAHEEKVKYYFDNIEYTKIDELLEGIIMDDTNRLVVNGILTKYELNDIRELKKLVFNSSNLQQQQQ